MEPVRPPGVLRVVSFTLALAWGALGAEGCETSRAREAPPPPPEARGVARSPGPASPPSAAGRPAASPAAGRSPSVGNFPGLDTGLKDKGIFGALDARVRWRVPANVAADRTRVVVDKKRRVLVLAVDGVAVKAYPIALGFAPEGHKGRQGDGRTPEGEYRIVEKRHRDLPAKYGARSLLLSYPNVKDGRAGVARGLIPAATLLGIEAAERRGAVPPQETPLGGSLRIHGGGVGRDWTLGCIAMRDADVVELYRHLRVGTPVVIHGGTGPRPPWNDQDGDGIPDGPDVLLGALKTALNGARYRASYVRIPYPGGDVPADIGVCTDVVVRALRNAGIDLQAALQRHLRAQPRRYPWIRRPDANIDHRRVRNLLVWFQAHAHLLGTTVGPDRRHTLLPGDIVFLDTLPRSGPDHLGVIADTLGPGGWPQVINNWTDGYRTQAMDLLPGVPITHHFRLR